MSKRSGPGLCPHEPYDVEKQDWARIAGFMDGEGCIHAPRSRPNTFPRTQCIISQRDVRPLLWIRDLLQGSVWQDKFGLWKWKLASTFAVEDLLFHIEPYLIVKRTQAQIGLQLIQLCVCGASYDDPMVSQLEKQIVWAKKEYEDPNYLIFYDDVPPTYLERTGKTQYRRRISTRLVAVAA